MFLQRSTCPPSKAMYPMTCFVQYMPLLNFAILHDKRLTIQKAYRNYRTCLTDSTTITPYLGLQVFTATLISNCNIHLYTTSNLFMPMVHQTASARRKTY